MTDVCYGFRQLDSSSAIHIKPATGDELTLLKALIERAGFPYSPDDAAVFVLIDSHPFGIEDAARYSPAINAPGLLKLDVRRIPRGPAPAYDEPILAGE